MAAKPLDYTHTPRTARVERCWGRAAAVGQVASVPGPSPCLVERTRQLIPNHLKTTLDVLTSLWERWCRRCSFLPHSQVYSASATLGLGGCCGGVRDQRPRQTQRGWESWRGEVVSPWDGFCELSH